MSPLAGKLGRREKEEACTFSLLYRGTNENLTPGKESIFYRFIGPLL